MKIKAPFQGQWEHAGQGFDGQRSYDLVKWVLRAYCPSKYREYRWKFVQASLPVRKYH